MVDRASALFVPPKPLIFFGRDDTINVCVDDLVQPPGRILIITHTEKTSPKFPCHRLQISGLDTEAARQTLLAVYYPMISFDAKIVEIFSDLGSHPLANMADMNNWCPRKLEKAWRKRQTELKMTNTAIWALR